MAGKSRVRESDAQIMAELRAKIAGEVDVDLATEAAAKELQTRARAHAPVRTGKYAAGIKIKRKKKRINGMPARTVEATDFKSHMVEFGTGPDGPDSKSPFGPDTPTPAFAPMGKAAHEMRGTLDGVTVD